MNITSVVTEQLELFLYSIILGAFFGVIYCFLKVIKTILGSNIVIESIINLLYFPLCAIMFFFFVIEFGGGAWRFYMMVGVFLGAIVYILTLGRVLTLPLCFLINKIREILHRLLRLIKEKMLKMDLKNRLSLLYNKCVYRKGSKHGTKGKSKKKQKSNS